MRSVYDCTFLSLMVEFGRYSKDSAGPNYTHGKLTLTASLKALNGETAFTLFVGGSPTVQNLKIALYLAGIGFRIALCLSEPNGELRYLTDAAVLQEHGATCKSPKRSSPAVTAGWL